MKQLVLIFAFLFSFLSYGYGGVIETATAIAIQQELAQQAHQDGSTHLEKAKKGAEEYENLLNKKASMIEEDSEFVSE